MARQNNNGKRHATQQSLNAAVKSICDVMRRSNCAGAMKYVPELTWILFRRILDEREARDAEEAAALGLPFTPSLQAPYRWRDWADKDSTMRQNNVREQKKTKRHTPEELEKALNAWKKVEREARENQAKAQEIEDAVYDLKAVNPNRVTVTDIRTPVELLDYISVKGREADEALTRLRQLVADAGP